MASELVFINTSGPDDSKSVDKRKAVRSQAAKDHSQTSSSKPEGGSRKRRRKLLSVEIELDLNESSSSSGSPPVNTESGPWDSRALSDRDRIGEDIKEEEVDRHVGELARVGTRDMPGAGWTHPFVPYPDESFVPAMLSHDDTALSAMTVDAHALDSPGNKGASRSIWFPMVIGEQAVVNVVVLTAASDHIAVHQTQCSPEVLWKLKEDAISSINRGLQDPELATSDAMIGAVAKMAAYEAGFAVDAKQHQLHMSGLSKMVELRGGLESLGSNGLLARMLLWVDLNAAFILKTKPVFSQHISLPEHTVAGPSPGYFSSES